jgi:hypothetical protein
MAVAAMPPTAVAPSTMTPATMTPAPTSATVPAAAPAPAPPGTYADEQSFIEPSRPVKAVGSTGVGVIRVIAPFTNRRSVNHGSGNKRRADSNIFLNILILGYCRYREWQNQERC